MKKEVRKDRVYRLIGKSPLSFTLHYKSTPGNMLLHDDGGVPKEIRYVANQSSALVEEQKGELVIEPIVFEDGLLFVPKENTGLQQFLEYHPKNGQRFEELDEAKDASEENAWMDLEDEAIEAARELSLDVMEIVYSVGIGGDPMNVSTEIIKRDVRKLARRSPQTFLDIINDPDIKVRGHVAKMFNERILRLRKKNEIYFNLKDNKSRMLVIPFGTDPVDQVTAWMKSDEGLQTYKLMIDKLASI